MREAGQILRSADLSAADASSLGMTEKDTAHSLSISSRI